MTRAGLATLLLACLWAQSASAQLRVVVRPFQGAAGESVRDGVVQTVAEADDMQLVTNKETDTTQQWLKVSLADEAGRVAVAAKLSISAFVEGDVQERGASTTVQLRVYNGSDGALLGEANMRAPRASIGSLVQRRFMPELGDAIRRGQPPPSAPEPLPAAAAPTPAAAAPSPAQPTPPAASPTPPAPAKTNPPRERAEPAPKPLHHHALELELGLLGVTRHLSYRDALIKLSSHTVPLTPALLLSGRWYPAGHLTDNFVSNLGIDLNGLVMWPGDAEKNGQKFSTSGTEFGVGARLRIPLKQHEIGVVVGYGSLGFAIDDSASRDSGVPSVSYGFVRLGADGRVWLLKELALQMRAAYLALTSYGEIGERAWFPHVRGGGFDAQLAVSYDVSKVMALSAGGGLTRFFLTLNPEQNDLGVSNGRIAGGVTDQYFYGLLGLTVRPY